MTIARRFAAFVALLLLVASSLTPCTVAVVSGKCTKDGRPLLWKHRDTDALQNIIIHFTGPKHTFLGLVDAVDSLRAGVWVGVNDAGFAIMNSASYNLILKDTVALRDQEGVVMKRALGECTTVADFAHLLDALPKPLGVEANFGVIDANGGAAFFEVDNFAYHLLDVNDPSVAPLGYLVHTNFSFTGDPHRGSGHIRFETVSELFFGASEQGQLDERFILQDASRCLKHSVTRVQLDAPLPAAGREPQFVPFEDFIPRYSTSASVVVQGVRAGEPAQWATMWTILGSPLTSVVLPLWVFAGPDLPRLVRPGADGNAPICSAAIALKHSLFPLIRSYGERYMNVRALVNTEGTGILQRLRPLEDRVFAETWTRLGAWRTRGGSRADVLKYYQWLDETVGREMEKLAGQAGPK
jgi:hypothetical protein